MNEKSIFESIKHVTEYGGEFWYARELMPILGYDSWRRFDDLIERAKIACDNTDMALEEEFLTAPSKTSKDGGRPQKDYILSRYACYLVAQNGDSRKPEVANAQSYFAVKTREREIDEQLIEDKKRVMLRRDIKGHNVLLAAAAKDVGVVEPIDYAIFQNSGYKGLYNGLDVKGIHKKKELKKLQKILDHMGSEELAANLFRATQAEAKLKREGIHGKMDANKAHYEVGQTVRKTIEELGGTMPEDLPSVDGVKKVEKRLRGGEDKLDNNL